MNPPDLLNIDARESSHRQRLEWRIQQIFLIFLYAAILAVMLGAVGEGVLSHASLGMPSGPLQLEYERFLRYRSAENLHIRIHHGSPTAHLSLSKNYFRNVGLQRIMPEPKAVIMTEKAVILTFSGTPSEVSSITLTVSPDKVGRQHGWIAVDDYPPLLFSQFVYP